MYLNEMNTTVSMSLPSVGLSTDELYVVDYGYGRCVYRMFKSGNRIKQNVLLLVDVDMGDVIEMVHKKTPLSSEDFNGVNMEIRTDSLRRVEDYITTLSLGDNS